MKTQMTQKAVNTLFKNVISVPYCKLQYLLMKEEPRFYLASNTYGWNCDVYDFGETAIVTGYRPFGNVKPDSNTLCKYEVKANKLISEGNSGDSEKKLRKLIDKFIAEVVPEENI